MSATALRPLGIGEILDVAIKTYSNNARTLITIGAIVGVPLELLNGVVQLSTVSSADDVSGSFSFASSSDNTSTSFSGARAGGLVVSLLISFVVALLLTAACVKAVSDAYLGTTPSVRDSLRFAIGRISSLAWLYVVLGLGLLLATFALVIPGIWLYVAWAVATPVLLIERVRGTAALRRSFRLVRHRWWPTAGLLLVSAIILGVTGAVLGGLLIVIPTILDSSSVLLAVVTSTVSSAIAAMLVQPLQAAITTILYFDLRVRKEGFDLSLLAARLGLPVPELPPFSVPAGRLAPGAGSAEQPPFWPPPPGWKPSAAGAGGLAGAGGAAGAGAVAGAGAAAGRGSAAGAGGADAAEGPRLWRPPPDESKPSSAGAGTPGRAGAGGSVDRQQPGAPPLAAHPSADEDLWPPDSVLEHWAPAGPPQVEPAPEDPAPEEPTPEGPAPEGPAPDDWVPGDSAPTDPPPLEPTDE